MSDTPELRVGIDNGISGAIAILAGRDLLAWLSMPARKVKANNEVDVLTVWKFIATHVPSQQLQFLSVHIEEPLGSRFPKMLASMTGTFHALRVMCEMKGVRWTRVAARDWQKPMLQCEKGQNKVAALALARRLWPEETWLPTPKCSVVHNGAVDAALIAEHARREKL